MRRQRPVTVVARTAGGPPVGAVAGQAVPAATHQEELLSKVRRLELISDLFGICNSTSKLSELMDKVFRRIIESVGAEAGSLWLIDEGSSELTCHVAEGPTRDKVQGLKLPAGSGVVGYVIESGKEQTVYDAESDQRFSTSVDQKTGFKTRSMICAPLIVENRAIGAVQLLNKRAGDGKFSPDDLALLRMLCQTSATPIVNARLRTSEQKVQELSALLEISKEITATLDLDSCLLSVVNLCSKLIDYDRAVVALVRGDAVKIAAISGQMRVDEQDDNIQRLHKMLEAVYRARRDIYVASGKKYAKSEGADPHVVEYIDRYHPGTLAVYRLYDEESDLGLFMMEAAAENLIGSALADRIAILKNMMTVALRNAQLYNSVRSFSVLGSIKGVRRLSLRKLGIGAAAVLAVVLSLALIRPAVNVRGSFDVLPSRSCILYSPLDQAVVGSIHADPAKPVAAGDTLLVFETDELLKELTDKTADIAGLEQKLAGYKAMSLHQEYHRASLDLDKAVAQRASLQRRIDASFVRSPVDGVLASDALLSLVGRRFSKGDELLEVVETGAMQLKLYVRENDIHRIQPGQACRFAVPAYPGRTFRGTVRQVTFDIREEDGVEFPVLVSVEEPGVTLLPGMSGKAKVRTAPMSLLGRLAGAARSYLAMKYWI